MVTGKDDGNRPEKTPAPPDTSGLTFGDPGPVKPEDPPPEDHRDRRAVIRLRRLIDQKKVPYTDVEEALEAACAGAPLEIGLLVPGWLGGEGYPELPEADGALQPGLAVRVGDFVRLGPTSIAALVAGARSVRWLIAGGLDVCLTEPFVVDLDRLVMPAPDRRKPATGKKLKSIQHMIALLGEDVGYRSRQELEDLAKVLVNRQAEAGTQLSADDQDDPEALCWMILGEMIRWFADESDAMEAYGTGQTPNQSETAKLLFKLLDERLGAAGIKDGTIRNERVIPALKAPRLLRAVGISRVATELQVARNALEEAAAAAAKDE